MKTFFCLLLLVLALPLAAETQADRDLSNPLLRSARELDDRATKLRDRNRGMSDDEAVDRVMAGRDAVPPAPDSRLESDNTDGIGLLVTAFLVLAYFTGRKMIRRDSLLAR